MLDELPEFGNRMLEMLRQPLEDKQITISRAAGSLAFPTNFMLVGSMNPCPCGYYGDNQRACTCSNSAVQNYQKRIPSTCVLRTPLRTGSGPLLDRIDIHVQVPRVDFDKLTDGALSESSESVRERVERARQRLEISRPWPATPIWAPPRCANTAHSMKPAII